MALTEVHTCCGVKYALSRTGNWIFLTHLPPGAPASTWGELFTPDEFRLVRQLSQPDRQAQRQAIEAMLTRHFAHATDHLATAPAAAEPEQPAGAQALAPQALGPVALPAKRGEQLGGTDPAVAPRQRR